MSQILVIHLTPIQVLGLNFMLTVSLILTMIGFFGFLTVRDNVILFLISNELVLLGLIVGFVSLANYWNDINGLVVALVLLVVSGVETVLVLMLFLLFYQGTGKYHLDLLDTNEETFTNE